jgi:hypothetical protein
MLYTGLLLRENDKIIAHYKKVGAINAVHRFAAA